MRKLLLLFVSLVSLCAKAQQITVSWELSDINNVFASTVQGDEAYVDAVTKSGQRGGKIARMEAVTGPNVPEGSEAVAYTPAFTAFTPTTRVTEKTTGHWIRFSVRPTTDHTFKPVSVSFDACKVGTDGGNFDVYYQVSTETPLQTGVSPLRNKIEGTNTTGYSHYEYTIGDAMALPLRPFYLYLYIYNLNGTDTSTPKSIAFRNIKINGVMDEKLYLASDFIESFSCKGTSVYGVDPSEIDLSSLVLSLENGQSAKYAPMLYGAPTDFNFKLKDGYTAKVDYSASNKVATVKIYENEVQKFVFYVNFFVSNRVPKGPATPLNRGLMAVSLSGAGMGTGNLVSWRFRESDDQGTKFKLYRGNSLTQTTALNSGKYIINKTNFRDASGTTSSYYKLETYDKYGHLLSTEVSRKAWANQTMTVKTSVPVDTRNGATYSPNDASFCDMDGDGEYEIILKWSPSNEKDAASNGTTSNPIFDCYKLDGTKLWRIDLGPNFFNSAHTIQFIAWDFDGDGYGEFMCKTAPGTIDGEGNYVLMGSDKADVNLLSSRGKQDHGSEYITVFDGKTGAEISTIKYHTDYNAGLSYWGDSKQNRSERYLAGLAYLDGPDKNPSPIFARGYYSGAFVGAYDFDGKDLKLRWLSKNTSSGKGLWGEGAHWMSCGDCDGDGKHEIVYGSSALDHDGSLLYRTGLGHGDALHLGDFLPDREGLEVFMVHEHSPYGYDLRDAKTGEFIQHVTAGSDTGRGLAAHFDSSKKGSQFIYSASGAIFDCDGGKEIASSWAIGSSGAGINCRVYWDGDLYDEFFDKSIIAHWNPTGKYFDRIRFNNGNYLWGNLNNSSKNNPCVLGDILGDWREEIVTWDNDTKSLIICATSYESTFRVPHLMDDLNYRVQVVNQNCAYNQPPHLSYDPSIRYKGNPNVAVQEDEVDPNAIFGVEADTKGDDAYYTLQGVKVAEPTKAGFYIHNGKKIFVR